MTFTMAGEYATPNDRSGVFMSDLLEIHACSNPLFFYEHCFNMKHLVKVSHVA